MINIRSYKPSDVSQMPKLFSDLGYPCDTPTIKNRLENILKHEDYYALTMLKNDEIIGFCGFCKMYMFETDQTYIRILAFVIDSDYRGKKYGSTLLKAVEEIAFQLNSSIVTFNSGNRNERDIAHKFYNKNGYVIKSSGFIKNLNN
ncbi:GNAT family N-acetyltransferase [Macrococcus equi]|uniref:GNAT family N-acetyltransferase n=1 Tax=Macrococcus equi TaxID=3395462 RepID=UPI0039BE8B0C